MAEQQRITGYFQSVKRGHDVSSSRKRKLSTDFDSTKTVDTTVSTPTKKAKSINLKSRSQLLVELAQTLSPVKPSSPLKQDASRPIVASPIKCSLPSLSKPIPSSPVKAKTDPAYSRFKYLAEKDSEKALFLPSKYCKIVDTFTTVDGILSLLQKQNQQTTFDRIKQGVERVSSKTFTQLKLSQLKSIYEDAYILKYEKTSQSDKNQVSKLSYVLIVTPSRWELGPQTELVPVELKPSVTISRKNEFISRLVEIVKDHHEKFLMSLDPPIRVDNKKIIRWHPNFKLELVPDIEIKTGIIPEPPFKKSVQLTVDSFLAKTKRPQDLSTKRHEDQVKSDNSKATPDSPSKITSGALKGLSSGFLDKIRAKEAQNLARELMRSPETEKKLSMIKQLPNFMRSLRNYFVGEQKSTIPLENVIQKLRDSYATFVSGPEVEDHLQYMTTLLPDWILILKVRRGSFVKIQNMSKNLSDLEERLNQTKAKLEASLH